MKDLGLFAGAIVHLNILCTSKSFFVPSCTPPCTSACTFYCTLLLLSLKSIHKKTIYTPDTQGITGFSSAIEKEEDKNLQKCDAYVLEAKQMYLKMI